MIHPFEEQPVTVAPGVETEVRMGRFISDRRISSISFYLGATPNGVCSVRICVRQDNKTARITPPMGISETQPASFVFASTIQMSQTIDVVCYLTSTQVETNLVLSGHAIGE